MNILEFIPIGKENAISRRRLCEMTKLTDRHNRDLIKNARCEAQNKDEFVINLQDGYYISDNTDDLVKQLRLIRSIMKPLKKEEKALLKILKDEGVTGDWITSLTEK